MPSRFPSCILATFLSPLATLSISGQSYCHFVYYVRMSFGHPSSSISPASYAVFVSSFSRIVCGSSLSIVPALYAGYLSVYASRTFARFLFLPLQADLIRRSKTRHSPECRAFKKYDMCKCSRMKMFHERKFEDKTYRFQHWYRPRFCRNGA